MTGLRWNNAGGGSRQTSARTVERPTSPRPSPPRLEHPAAADLPELPGVRWFRPDEDLTHELDLSGACGAAVATFAREVVAIDRFIDAGIDAPNRVLFWGPSGTGKTLAARWLGWTLKAPLALLDVSEIVSKYLGETSNNLGNAFKAAKAARAILFLDEIDGVCSKRTGGSSGSADAELQRSTTTLLQQQQVDWIGPRSIVIAATNFRDAIDTALLRRLTVQIEFELPDLEARRRMVRRWLAKAPVPPDAVEQLAAQSEGIAGADLRSRAMSLARRAILAAPAPPKVSRAERDQVALQRGTLSLLGELEKLEKDRR